MSNGVAALAARVAISKIYVRLSIITPRRASIAE
jgi:hypothetical protein